MDKAQRCDAAAEADKVTRKRKPASGKAGVASTSHLPAKIGRRTRNAFLNDLSLPAEDAERAQRFAIISKLNPGGMTGDAREINQQKLAFEGQ